MSKQPYRSELGMISDILQVTMDYGRQGTIITTIARRANLSHYTATDKCQKLIDFGLMESRADKRSNFFAITEKGIHFYEELQRFTETMQAIRVRY
ncbi:MAG: transcriptional regulator [Thaumarchaeota archaeon]|nr:transcriptional regulator [Nitrososphaerota archaeon]